MCYVYVCTRTSSIHILGKQLSLSTSYVHVQQQQQHQLAVFNQFTICLLVLFSIKSRLRKPFFLSLFSFQSLAMQLAYLYTDTMGDYLRADLIVISPNLLFSLDLLRRFVPSALTSNFSFRQKNPCFLCQSFSLFEMLFRLQRSPFQTESQAEEIKKKRWFFLFLDVFFDPSISVFFLLSPSLCSKRSHFSNSQRSHENRKDGGKWKRKKRRKTAAEERRVSSSKRSLRK